jgi:peptidoglycan/LPS O-acetylase OafA/YrhL
MPGNLPDYRREIDGLRGIAVLLVVVYHLFPRHLPGGLVGVDIFFVISGFLITRILLRSQAGFWPSLTQFYARRIRRIFPALGTVLVFCLACGYFTLFPDEYSLLGQHIAVSPLFLNNFMLAVELDYFHQDAETRILLHLWSLAVEEQFYLLWPLLVLTLSPIHLRWVVVLLIGASFGGAWWAGPNDPEGAFYFPHWRAWELGLGSLIALISPSKTLSKTLAEPLSLLGLGLITADVLVFNSSTILPQAVLLSAVGTALILLAGPHSRISQFTLTNAPLVGIGLISYPLYLWHWPLLSLSRTIHGRDLSMEYLLGCGLLSLLLAWLTYRYIETPVRRATLRPALTVGLVAGALWGIGVGGYALQQSKGLPSREAFFAYTSYQRTPRFTPECRRRFVPTHSCLYDDVGGRETVAVVGDSHARATYYGIVHYARQNGKNTLLLAKGACPFLQLPYQTTWSRPRRECHDTVQQVFKYLSGNPTIRTVVISIRGNFYLTGVDFPQTPNPEQSFIGKAGSLPPDQLLRQSLQETVNALRKAGKQVIFILDNPELVGGTNPRDCVERPFRRIAGHCPPRVTRQEALEWQQNYRQQVAQVTGMITIDPFDKLCPDEVCQIFNDGKLLYYDDDHLTNYGSIYQVTDQMARYLED